MKQLTIFLITAVVTFLLLLNLKVTLVALVFCTVYGFIYCLLRCASPADPPPQTKPRKQH